MLDQIEDELARSDLTTQTAAAVITAIQHYQQERFFFSESREVTFSTVIGQEFYTDSDLDPVPLPLGGAGISRILAFDYLILYLGSIPWPLHRRQPIDIETLNQNGLMRGQPWNFAYYEQKIRLGPVPDGVYQMRIAGHFSVGGPATLSDTTNPWFTFAEKLIRSRIKWEIYKNVIRDEAAAASMKEQEEAVLEEIKSRTNRLTGTGMMTAMAF